MQTQCTKCSYDIQYVSFVGIQKNKMNVIPTIKDLFNNNETDNPFNEFVCFLFTLGNAR